MANNLTFESERLRLCQWLHVILRNHLTPLALSYLISRLGPMFFPFRFAQWTSVYQCQALSTVQAKCLMLRNQYLRSLLQLVIQGAPAFYIKVFSLQLIKCQSYQRGICKMLIGVSEPKCSDSVLKYNFMPVVWGQYMLILEENS